jgi:hypothetical protein
MACGAHGGDDIISVVIPKETAVEKLRHLIQAHKERQKLLEDRIQNIQQLFASTPPHDGFDDQDGNAAEDGGSGSTRAGGHVAGDHGGTL